MALDQVLDDLERANSLIRYYRFLKGKGEYVFKTFIDYPDGHTFQFLGRGPTRIDAVIDCMNNIIMNLPTLSDTNRASKKRRLRRTAEVFNK